MILAAIGIGILVGVASYGIMTLANKWIADLISGKVDKMEDKTETSKGHQECNRNENPLSRRTFEESKI